MKILTNFLKISLIVFTVVLAFNSCVLDEFKVDGIKTKEDSSREIVAPLFHGNFEFKDLIHTWEEMTIEPGEQISNLDFQDGNLVEIPTRIIFEPTIIINNFPIWINGGFNFSKVDFKYTVSNGAPFPLNIQMQFSESFATLNSNPVVLPPPFSEANYDGANFIPIETDYTLTLNEEQLQSFLAGEMVQFQSWFNSTDLVNSRDTFLSNYPITISVVLHAEIDGNN